MHERKELPLRTLLHEEADFVGERLVHVVEDAAALSKLGFDRRAELGPADGDLGNFGALLVVVHGQENAADFKWHSSHRFSGVTGFE
jgi:hypothetical protein